MSGRGGSGRIGDLDNTSIVAAFERWGIGMELLQVLEMLLGHFGRTTAVLAHV